MSRTRTLLRFLKLTVGILFMGAVVLGRYSVEIFKAKAPLLSTDAQS